MASRSANTVELFGKTLAVCPSQFWQQFEDYFESSFLRLSASVLNHSGALRLVAPLDRQAPTAVLYEFRLHAFGARPAQ
jgi:hypothetical protein